MPGKSPGDANLLMKKYGNRLRASHEKHKDDETTYSSLSNVPPGITGGVAELETCEVREIAQGKPNAGEPQFYASAIIREPIEHTWEEPPGSGVLKTMKVEGLRTFITEPLFDTPNSQGNNKTFESHYARFLNHLRKLGYDTSAVAPEDIVEACQALENANPPIWFYFTTSSFQPDKTKPPMTMHNWDKLVEDNYSPPEVSPTTQVDNTGKNPQKVGPAPSTNGVPAEDLEFGDIDSLVKSASNKKDSGYEKACDALTEMAVGAGYTKDQIDDADSWEEVGNWIKDGGQEEEVPTPIKGEVWKTRLPDSKDPKKKSAKLSQVEIMAVNEKKGIADVKDLVTKKVLKGIPFSDLISAD